MASGEQPESIVGAVPASPASCVPIINETLCYIQNKMDNMPTDELCKIVLEFYTGGRIESAKTMLYESCEGIEGERMKKRKQPNKHLNNVRDIIDRFNEVGLAAPQFVARNLSNMPPTALGGFDIAKIVKSLADMAEVFGVLKCLQEDLGTVQHQFAGLENLTKEVASIKEMLGAKHASKPETKVATGNRHNAELNRSNDNSISESSEEEVTNRAIVSSITEADDESDGFTLPRKRRRLKRKPQLLKRTYAETAAMTTTARPTANKPTMLRSCRRNSSNVPEKVVSKLRVASRRSGVPEKDVGDMQRSSVAKLFVSRLHDETTVAEMKAHLSVICKDQLVRVQRVDTRTNDYASFKVTVPAKLKAKLLSKKCWPEGANIRNFVDKFNG